MSASLRFAPMSLAVLNESFDHEDFIFELKYDGFRALAHVAAVAAASFPATTTNSRRSQSSAPPSAKPCLAS